jgi:hypothetical protein
MQDERPRPSGSKKPGVAEQTKETRHSRCAFRCCKNRARRVPLSPSTCTYGPRFGRLPAQRLPAGVLMASTQIRNRRRTLLYRHLLVRQMVQIKNRIPGLLMETA